LQVYGSNLIDFFFDFINFFEKILNKNLKNSEKQKNNLIYAKMVKALKMEKN
jgi:hypothetical protein